MSQPWCLGRRGGAHLVSLLLDSFSVWVHVGHLLRLNEPAALFSLLPTWGRDRKREPHHCSWIHSLPVASFMVCILGSLFLRGISLWFTSECRSVKRHLSLLILVGQILLSNLSSQILLGTAKAWRRQHLTQYRICKEPSMNLSCIPKQAGILPVSGNRDKMKGSNNKVCAVINC